MHPIRLASALFAAAALIAVPLAQGATSNVVVSQIYAGGGNSGAAYANDFVELLNRSATAVDLSGWTVQYASAASASWQSTALSGSIAPGHYYLVQLASTADVGASLPTTDATGTTNLASTGGKVALVRDTASLACGTSAGSCASAPLVEDLVGYGSAADYEGSGPAPALGATTAAVRAGAGCTDTDSNAADFAAAAPTPRDALSPAAACAASPPTGSTAVPASASVDAEVQPVLAISVAHSSLSFGDVVSGTTPTPLSERVTVVSNDASGYAVTVGRSPFAPADLPLGIASPVGGTLLPIPIAPAAELPIASSTVRSADAGDVWPTSVGFAAPLPVAAPGHYTATLTFTVIGR